MRAGQLRERVTFYARGPVGTAAVSDGYGNSEGAWVEQFTIAAAITPLQGREEIQAQRLQGTQPVTITVRSCADTRAVTPDWRAENARTGALYNVRAVAPAETRDWIEFMCEAGVADG
jgi:SPP1 family predicted phage head-tail adaptor